MKRDSGKKTIRKRGVPKDKIAIGVIVILVMLMFIAKQKKSDVSSSPVNESITAESIITVKLPHLIEFGSEGCVPCKMMKPIIDELAKEYKGQMVVKFIDVYEAPSVAEKYSIRAIPTQIFFDADGREIARHTGFFPKDEILAQWKSLGYEFKKVEDNK